MRRFERVPKNLMALDKVRLCAPNPSATDLPSSQCAPSSSTYGVFAIGLV